MADQKDAKEDISEDELDQIIQDMSKDEEVEATPANKPALEMVQAKKKTATPAVTTSTGTGTGSNALTLEMNGVVNLKLCFKSGERSIEVLCTEEHLLCKMADGTEFKIPTGNGKARKAA